MPNNAHGVIPKRKGWRPGKPLIRRFAKGNDWNPIPLIHIAYQIDIIPKQSKTGFAFIYRIGGIYRPDIWDKWRVSINYGQEGD
jgi:hypothetical protein